MNDAAQLSRDFMAEIRKAMAVRGITDADLGRILFRSRGAITSNLDAPHGCPVTLRTMAKFANALGLRIVIKLEASS